MERTIILNRRSFDIYKMPYICVMRDYSPFPATFPQLRADSVRVTHPCATRQPPEGAAAVRLACIKPAASVHPEPGSNSPYYFLVFLFRSSLFLSITYLFSLLFQISFSEPTVAGSFLALLKTHFFFIFLTLNTSSFIPICIQRRLQMSHYFANLPNLSTKNI